jgi:hypothetical protein
MDATMQERDVGRDVRAGTSRHAEKKDNDEKEPLAPQGLA